MPDLEKEKATTEEEPDSFEKFAEEYAGAKYQERHPEESEEKEEKEAEEKPAPETLETKTPAEDAPKDAEPEVKTEETPLDDGEAEANLYTLPDEEVFGDLRGQRVTAAQMEEAGLINKVITRDHQEMHNTKLYNDLKREFDEKLDAAKVELAPKPVETPEVPVDPKVYADDIEARYVPVLKKLAEAGSFEPDFIEAYPKFASQTANQIETMRVVGAGLVKAVQEIHEWVGIRQGAEAQDESLTHLDGAMAALAKSDDLYADLATPEEREAFTNWMRDPENPQPWKKMNIVEELSLPKALKGAFAAYRVDTRHLRSNKPASETTDTRERAALAAAGGGVARQTSKTAEPNEFEKLKQDFDDSRARAFGR